MAFTCMIHYACAIKARDRRPLYSENCLKTATCGPVLADRYGEGATFSEIDCSVLVLCWCYLGPNLDSGPYFFALFILHTFAP